MARFRRKRNDDVEVVVPNYVLVLIGVASFVIVVKFWPVIWTCFFR